MFTLQPFTTRDYARMAKIVANDELGMQRLAWYANGKQWAASTSDRRGALLVLDGKNKVIGFIDVDLINSSDADFAYYLIPAVRGNKLGTEVLELLKEWAREHDIALLKAYLEADNAASRKALQRANFVAEGEVEGLVAYGYHIVLR